MGNYITDILNDGFEQVTIDLPQDEKGRLTATLVRRLAKAESHKAVLYIHGFNDYFFQKEMGFQFNQHGFNFYALDLRRYGRSYLPHQKLNDVRNIEEYFEEITFALIKIREEGNTSTLLSGHSTGGLIVSLYAGANSSSKLYDALFLNSPFFEFNINWITQHVGLPVVSVLAKVLRDQTVSGGFAEQYGLSLHQSGHGEWDYNLQWKPHTPPKVSMGWIKAIRDGHKKLKQGLSIHVPVLIMHSATSYMPENGWSDKLLSSDAILNVDDIRKKASCIDGDVTRMKINGGMHDLVLSAKPVREEVYTKLFEWLHLKNI